MTAKPLTDSIRVLQAYDFNGHKFVEVPCADYDVLCTLPAALVYDGRTYGRTGWNSDSCKAYYRTDVQVALRGSL